MSKAAIKREKQLRERLTNVLNHRLIDFKDMYLNSYVNWSKKSIQTRINNLKESHGKPFNDEGRFKRQGLINNTKQIERLETQLSRDMLLTLEFINEANKSYNVKIEKLIEKLVKADISTISLKFEKIGNIGAEFEFLVSDDKIKVHARVIFANGCVNAPHFRFITTTRNK
jgi:hypothetical protein